MTESRMDGVVGPGRDPMMQECFEASMPSSEFVLNRMADARCRAIQRAKRTSKRRVPGLVLGVLVGTFCCSSAYAWGVSEGYFERPEVLIEKISELSPFADSESRANSPRRSERAVLAPNPADKQALPERERTDENRPEIVAGEASASEKRASAKTPKQLVEKIPSPRRRDGSRAQMRKQFAKAPSTVAAERSASWTGIDAALSGGDVDLARRQARALARQSAGVNRESAQLLEIQLALGTGSLAHDPTSEEAQLIRRLAREGASATIRRRAAALLNR